MTAEGTLRSMAADMLASAPTDCDDLPRYIEIPLRFDADYERDLGEVRVSLTEAGFAELLAQVGECPCCGRPMAEGEMH